MLDFLGNELQVGDEVVLAQRKYRNLLKGVIERLTPTQVVITHEKTNVGSTTTRQYPSQLVKIIKGV